ncbi:signal transduction histidine kinase [Deinococcus sp. HSC-46F16]|uniref:sensor histidine kinase n=1 Tax=Deinococcus sp. HSC-46F16 TaxID=2910968 RepID=UPI0020A1E08A|nr:ATP-binding protein [Deinococcus sp. HSC-46F16]MCP2014707.1 signal transduction histidine kinase [Deinococcus sp. HSC-46F16]
MKPLYRAALLAWMGGTLLVGLLWWSASARDAQVRFETGARILHRVLSQRSEQQEAVLASLTALARADVQDEALGQYASAMRAQYPQIVGVQRCRPRCEDLGPSGAALPQRPLPPDETGLRWHPTLPALYALSRGEVRVWVDARRLFREEDFSDLTSAFRLRRPGDGRGLAEWAAGDPVHTADHLLPVLRVSKVLGSVQQPFLLEGEHPLRWAELPVAGLGLLTLVLAGIAGAWVRLVEGRERARRAAGEARQALEAERARAEGAFHAVSEALIVTDAGYRVRLANPAARALVGSHLSEGRDLREAVCFRATLDQQPFNPDAFWGQPVPTELPQGVTLVTGEGARLVEGALALLPGEGEQGAGWVLVLRDVGPLRARVQAALEEGERRVREHAEMLTHVTRLSTLGEMSAGLAHELNQPLTAIVSHGQAALRLLGDPEREEAQVRRSVEATVTQAKRAASIIAHLRTLVKRAPTQTRPVDLNQVLENVATLTRHEAEHRGVVLTVRPSPAALIVQGDPVHLEQVLLNLVRNAAEAAGGTPRAEVRLSARPQGETALVEVRDTGPGLPDTVRDRLFTPFTTTKRDGLGLGLSLSHTLMQGMGGDLRGENVSGGAAFTLTLPLARREAAHA